MPDSKNNAGELMDKIKKALDNLVTLEIITAVGQVKLGDKVSPEIDYSKNPKVILTKINLIQGDIKTVYDPEFVTGEYQSLKDFHAKREDEGYEIIKTNIETLKSLFNFAKDMINED